MTFTIVFQSISYNLAYMLAFEPCPVWKKDLDSAPFLVPNPSNPHYELGSVAKLIKHENLIELISGRNCVVVIQEEGHGSEEDLKTLLLDLDNEGFGYNTCSL